MIALILVPLLPLGILLIARWGFFYEDYKTYTGDCDVVLKFETFLDYYYIAPEKYALNDYSVERKGKFEYMGNGSYYTKAKICFKLLDTIKYRRWLKKLRKQNELEENNAKLKEYLELVQEDINRIRGKEND